MTGGLPFDGTPPDPRRGRFRPLSVAMLRLLVVIAACASLAVLAPDPWGSAAGWATISALIAAPLLRVVWLVQRWLRRGDRRYAVIGGAVLAVVALGTALATL